MADTEHDGGNSSQPDTPESWPVMQRLLDNHFLLLFLGVVVPTIFYLIWGVMAVATIPIAK